MVTDSAERPVTPGTDWKVAATRGAGCPHYVKCSKLLIALPGDAGKKNEHTQGDRSAEAHLPSVADASDRLHGFDRSPDDAGPAPHGKRPGRQGDPLLDPRRQAPEDRDDRRSHARIQLQEREGAGARRERRQGGQGQLRCARQPQSRAGHAHAPGHAAGLQARGRHAHAPRHGVRGLVQRLCRRGEAGGRRREARAAVQGRPAQPRGAAQGVLRLRRRRRRRAHRAPHLHQSPRRQGHLLEAGQRRRAARVLRLHPLHQLHRARASAAR